MTTVEYVISGLSFVAVTLIGVVWWVLQQYITTDKAWKKGTDTQLLRHYTQLNALEHTLKSVRTALTGEIQLVELKLNQIKGDIKDLEKGLESHKKSEVTKHLDVGRVIVLEDKINAIFAVLKKHQKSN